MRSIGILLLLSLCLGACSLWPGSVPANQIVLPTSGATIAPSPTVESSPVPTVVPTPVPPATATIVRATPPPTDLPATPVATPAFDGSIPPFRDDVALAVAYLGVDPALPTLQPTIDLQPGAVDTFFIGNVKDNTIAQVEAERCV